MDTEYLKRVGLYVLCALVSIGLVFYFGYHIWYSATKEVETQPVTKVTMQRTVETDGYIFRSETPIYISSGGSVVPTAAEGERINVGGSIADVYSQSAPDAVAHIAEVNDRIELLRRSIGSGASSKDSSSIDSDIFSALSDMRAAACTGNAATAVSLRQSLLSAVNRRGLLTGSSSDLASEITVLEGERAALTATLGARLQSVTAQQSGYYYSSVDGYESIFDPALFDDMTYDSAVSLLATTPDGAASAGCAGKMVTSSVWYTVLRAERKYVKIFTSGSYCTVNFKSNEAALEMKVEKVLEGGDEAVFILSTRQIPSGFDYARVQKIELVETEYTGLRVPVGAVRIVDGETGVYVLDGSTVRFRTISVLYRGDGVCIVDPDPKTADANEEDESDKDGEDENKKENVRYPLELHENLIISGKGLYDGKVVGS